MFFKNLSESREVECLVVLDENEAEVELAECELHLVHLASLQRLLVFHRVEIVEEVVAGVVVVYRSLPADV